MFKRTSVTVVVAALVVSLAGCGGQDSTADEGPKDELRVAMAVMPKGPSHDPMMTTYTNPETRNLFDGLTGMTADLEVVPGLATEWENIEPDTWRFTLREGVTFHNGEEFDADDVVYTYERLSDEANASPQYTQMGYLEDVQKVDDYTVDIITKGPYAPLPAAIRFQFPIVPKDYIEEVGNEAFADEPVGTGPYKFVEWVRDQHIIHEAFEDYWGGAPEIKKITYLSAPEASTRTSMLLAGEADLIEAVLDTDVERIEGAGNAQIITAEAAYANYISIPALTEPYDDVRVRQAMNYAIDAEAIIDSVLGGNGKRLPITNSHSNIGFSDQVEPYPYDPDRARELLAEAGIGEGDLEPLELAVGQGRQPYNLEVAQAVESYLNEVGIPAKVAVQESTEQFERYAAGESTGLVYNGVTAVSLDSDHIFTLLYADDSRGNLYFDTTPTNDLVFEGQAALDDAERQGIYDELQQVIHDEAPHIFLHDTIDIYAAVDSLVWDGPLPTREMPFATAKFE